MAPQAGSKATSKLSATCTWILTGALTQLSKRSEIVRRPAPNFVLDTSQGKHQVVSKVSGLVVDEAESLLHNLANQFCGDLAATDATRVLRSPGFANQKLPAPQYLRNVIRIVTETGLRIYKELISMRKDQVDLQNAVVWIPDSKTPPVLPKFP